MFEHIHAPIDFSRFFGRTVFVFSEVCAITSRREERANSCTCCANAFRQIALRNKFQFELARAVQTVEHITICLARKAANQFVDAASFENRCQTSIAIACVVIHQREMPRLAAVQHLEQAVDQFVRNPSSAKPADHDGRAVVDFPDGLHHRIGLLVDHGF